MWFPMNPKNSKNVKLITFCFLMIQNIAVADTMRFIVPNYEPYTYLENGEIKGVGVESVKEVMSEIGVPYTLKLADNYDRVISIVESGDADGFFMASKSPERDSIAEFSHPLMVNKWGWIYLPNTVHPDPQSMEFKRTMRVGVILNSNPHKWLEKNKYNVTGAPKNIDKLLRMLESGRVDVIFSSELVFLNHVKKKNLSKGYIIETQLEQPFGIYISHGFIEKNRDIMDIINEAIDHARVIPPKN